MQLNNLILVPISNEDLTIFPHTAQIVTSPSKGLSKNCVIPDEICWKKSLSAFKKYKGKKDKQNKATKSSQNNISIIQQNQEEDLKKKVFELVESNIKYSLFDSETEKRIKNQQQTDYFDPNQAPFFQYGVQYSYEPSQISEQNEQENHQFYKKLQKTTKAKQESTIKQKKNQVQLKKKQEGNKYNQKQVYLNDPFIIIKSQRKNQILESIVKNEQLKREEIKKTKPIKKPNKFNRSVSMYGRQISGYSNPNSQSYLKQKSLNQMDIQYSNQDYGGQLPMIEFQLCNQFQNKDQLSNQVVSGTTRDNSSKYRQYEQKNQTEVKQEVDQQSKNIDGPSNKQHNLIMEFPFSICFKQQDQNGEVKLQEQKSIIKTSSSQNKKLKKNQFYNKKKGNNLNGNQQINQNGFNTQTDGRKQQEQ